MRPLLKPPFVVIDADGATRIILRDHLIQDNRQEFKDIVVAQLAAGARRFVIDATDAGYMDSSGLGVLTACRKRVVEAGGTVALHGLNDDLRTLFQLTKLDTLFDLGPEPTEARR